MSFEMNPLAPWAMLDPTGLTAEQKPVVGELVAEYGRHDAELRKMGTTLAAYVQAGLSDRNLGELPASVRESLDEYGAKHFGSVC